jgi:hypothetical protein
MDTIGVMNKFHRILLAWDYFEVCEKVEEGGGVVDHLRSVPDTFADVEVSDTAPFLTDLGAARSRGTHDPLSRRWRRPFPHTNGSCSIIKCI